MRDHATSLGDANADDLIAPVQALLGDFYARIGHADDVSFLSVAAFAGAAQGDLASALCDIRRFALLRLVEARFLGPRAGGEFCRAHLDLLQDALAHDYNLRTCIVLGDLQQSCLEVCLDEAVNAARINALRDAEGADISDHVFKDGDQHMGLAGDALAERGARPEGRQPAADGFVFQDAVSFLLARKGDGL